MLAVLTQEMPALAFMVTTWACTGLLGLPVHVLKFVLTKAEGVGEYRGRRLEWLAIMFKYFNMEPSHLELWISWIHNILNSIKYVLFADATKVVCLIVSVAQHIWKAIIQLALKTVIENAKNVFTVFLSWIDRGLRSLSGPAIA